MVVIKNMDLPKNCKECNFECEEENYYGDVMHCHCPYIYKGYTDDFRDYRRHKECPLGAFEPCEDAISRKQIKEKLQYVIDHGFAAADGQHPVSAERVLDYIIKMPSVAPKPRMGKWLINSDGYYPYCSECKTEPKSGEMTDFCPKCGAKMEG